MNGATNNARMKERTRRTSRTRTGVVLLAVACVVLLASAVPAHARTARTVYSPLQKRGFAYVIKPVHLGAVRSTWYGPGLWGRRTACGITLRPSSWGIAHRTLPCGKLVWLRYGRRSIAVPVIDRGPYGWADIDLTQRTADYLRFRRHGTGHVRSAVLLRTLRHHQLR